MDRRGRAARGLRFARNTPARAVVTIVTGGSPQVFSWDVGSGRLVQASAAKIRHAAITPDGRWVWWFDLDAGLWFRSPFGASPKGPLDRPLRLRPAADVRALPGGDGTAVVARTAPGGTANLSVLPVGRMRPGSEPVFLGRFEGFRGFARSRDESIVAVSAAHHIHILHARTGANISTFPIDGDLVGFTAAGEILVNRADAAQLWHPLRGIPRTLTLPDPHTGTIGRVTLDHSASGILAEALAPAPEGLGTEQVVTQVFAGTLPEGVLEPVGPTHGVVLPGSVVGGPDGRVYASWRAADAPERLTVVGESMSPSPDAAPGEGDVNPYPPVVGGVG